MLRRISLIAAGVSLVGCASASKSGETILQSSNGQPAPATIQWTGKFGTTTRQSGDAAAIRGQSKMTGNVRLIALSTDRLHADIELSNANSDHAQLAWALVSGRCGSNSIPALAVNQFPVIEINSVGGGRVSAEVPLALPTSGTYHVNVYLGRGGDEADVLACANLRMEPRS